MKSPGEKKREKQKKSEEFMAALESLGYAFKMNECNDDIEVNGLHISNPVEAKISMEMRDLGYRNMRAIQDTYTAYAYKNTYHPIKEYLWGLKPDGRDYISDVSRSFTDKYGVFTEWFRKWLIGAVRKVCEKGEQNPMLVMDGAQGIGKSTFVRWLCSGVSNELDGYFLEAPIHPDDKDDFVRLASIWIWEVSELGRTTRHSDVEALKHFLTMKRIHVRAAFERRPLRKPAMSSFLGTVNNESGLLSDSTGSRRFLICHITRMDWNYMDIDVDQLWAQVMKLYKDGETNELDDAQKRRSSSINEEYEIDNPIKGVIEKYMDVDKDNHAWWSSTTDLLERVAELGHKGNPRQHAMALAVAMNQLGLVKERRDNPRGIRVRGYVGIRLPQSQSQDIDLG